MNVIFILMVLCAFCFSGWQQIFSAPVQGASSPMAVLSAAMIKSAGGSVELAIGLVGVMALFLGLMKVAEAGGMLTILARLIRPLMVRLFPDVPADHPAMGAMILNLSANMLGLGNAATPFVPPPVPPIRRPFYRPRYLPPSVLPLLPLLLPKHTRDLCR